MLSKNQRTGANQDTEVSMRLFFYLYYVVELLILINVQMQFS